MNTNHAFTGDIYFTIVLNGSIHFIMYGYYLLRTFNIRAVEVVKPVITNSQLLQFCGMLGQALWLYFGACPFPRNVVVMYFVYIASLLALFWDFKKTTYGGGGKQERKGAGEGAKKSKAM